MDVVTPLQAVLVTSTRAKDGLAAASDLRRVMARWAGVASLWWRCPTERRRAWAYVSACIALSIVNVALLLWISYVQNAMQTSLSEKQEDGFWVAVWDFVLIIAVAAPLFALTDYVDSCLTRICDDVRAYTATSVMLSVSIMRKVLNCVAFASLLWRLAPQLAIFLVIYAVAGTWVTGAGFGRRLMRLTYSVLQREADLRFALVRVRENAESIAFYAGDLRESELASARLARVRWEAYLSLWQNVYSYSTILLPSLLLCKRYFAGEIRFGDISQASFAFRIIEGALSYIITHLSDISQLAAQTDRLDALLAALAANHSDAATAGDGVRRSDSKDGGVSVQDLTLTTPHGEQTLCKGLSLTLLPGQSLLVVGPSGCGKTSLMRAVAGLWSAGSGTIAAPPDMFFLPQRPYMPLGTLREQLTFPDSCAATMAAAAAAAAAMDDGDDPAGGPLPVPSSGAGHKRGGDGGGDSDSGEDDGGGGRRMAATAAAGGARRAANLRGGSYRRLSSGSSKQAADAGVGNGDGVSGTGSSSAAANPVLDAELRGLLDDVCLPSLLARVGGLDAELDWAHILSLGEQQRVSVARLLHHKPAVAFLDEATSALDTATERQLYGRLQQHCACFISIAHRKQLAAFHTHVLEAPSREMSRAQDGGSEPLAADSVDDRAVTSAAFRAQAGGGSRGRHCRQPIVINLASCKYSVLRVVQEQLGWEEDDDDEDAHVFWCDTSAGTERLMSMSPPQRLNHFPGMREIARKKGLARNLGNMSALFPAHYDFHPRTFLLPEQTDAFLAQLSSVKCSGGKGSGGGKKASTRPASGSAPARPTYILKLDNGSMGRGIRLVQTPAQAAAALPCFEHENVVASEYLPRPLLIDGRKCDLRIYVLVRSCAPLRAFLCRQGLVRLCAERYEPPAAGNLGRACMHLSNYAVNKHHAADAQEAGEGSKWTISAFAEWMRRQGHDFEALWSTVKELVAKTLISVQPMLQYQLLGLDVLIDEGLKPWLIEVNHSPSLSTDTPLDLEVKSRVVRESLELVGVQPERVHAELAAQEQVKQQRLYTGAATAAAARGAPEPDSNSEAAVVSSMLCGGGCAPLDEGADAPQSQRGSEQWLQAQREFEDAHLGQFERILPPADGTAAALYEQLLAGARQVFHRSTMEGRNQQKLNELRERRQQEEAEAAARQEAQQRRAEALKQWIAGVCQRHRQEKARQQELGQQHAAVAPPTSAAPSVAEASCADPGASSAAGCAAGSSRRDSKAVTTTRSSSGSDTSVQASATAPVRQFSHFADAQFALPLLNSVPPAVPAANRPQRRTSALLPGCASSAAVAATKLSRDAIEFRECPARTWIGLTADAAATDRISSGSGAASGSIVSGLGAGSSGNSFEALSSASLGSVGRCAEQLSAVNMCSSSSSKSSTSRSSTPVTLVSARLQQHRSEASVLTRCAGSSGHKTAASTPCPSRPSSAALSVWQAVSRRSSSAATEACQFASNSMRGAQDLQQQHAWDDPESTSLPSRPAASSSFMGRVAALQQHSTCGGETALQAQSSSGTSSASFSVPESASDSGRSSSSASTAEGVCAGACPGASGFDAEPTHIPAAMLSALSAVHARPSSLAGTRRHQSGGRSSLGQAMLGIPRAAGRETAASNGDRAAELQPGQRPVPVPALIPGVRSRCVGRSSAAATSQALSLPPACGKGGGSAAGRQYRAAIQRQAVKALQERCPDPQKQRLSGFSTDPLRRRLHPLYVPPGCMTESVAAQLSWVGPPLRMEGRATFYAAVNASGQEYRLGDAVYLRAAQPGQPPFIARLESLHEQHDDGSAWAVCGKCEVLTPAQAEHRPGGSATERARPNTFECSRKYIAREHRIVPLDVGMAGVGLSSALQEKPCDMVDDQVVQRSPTAAARNAAAQPRPKRSRSPCEAVKPATGDITALANAGPHPDVAHALQQQPHSKRQHREANSPPSRPVAGAEEANAAATDAAANACGAVRSIDQQLPSTSATTEEGSGLSGGKAGSSLRTSGAPRPRWSKERYDGAQQSLVASMRRLPATSADRATLRPALREEACKTIGDTGLLDHLLKHMAGQVVSSSSGERLQRRHNKDGQMVYWQQTPAAAAQEEEALRGEMETLNSELAEMREARRFLQTVRGDAALAIQAASGIKERPEEAIKALSHKTMGQAHAQPGASPSPGLHHGSTMANGSPPGAAAACGRVEAVRPQSPEWATQEGLPPTLVRGAPPADLKRQDEAAGSQRQLQIVKTLAQPAADAYAGGGGGLGAEACLLSSQLAAVADLARQLHARCEQLEHQAAANQLRIAGLEQQVAAVTAGPATPSAVPGAGALAVQAALLAASGSGGPSMTPSSGPVDSDARPASVAGMLRARQVTDLLNLQQHSAGRGPTGHAGQQATCAMAGAAQLWGDAGERPFGAGNNADPFSQQPQHSAGGAAIAAGVMSQLAMPPIPATGSMPPFSFPRHLQVQQQLAAAATMAVATQPCLSHAGPPAKGRPGSDCQPPPQQQQQGPQRQTLSGLMQDPRFARVLNPTQQIRSSVCSGPAGRAQSPPQRGTLDGTPLLVHHPPLAPSQGDSQLAPVLSGGSQPAN
ncbi:Tubulin polyglutamylase ttll6 [Chlorella vulgaris]